MRVELRRETFGIDVFSGVDEVVYGFPVPGDSIVENVAGSIHIVSGGVIEYRQVLRYRIDGWALPILDLDTATDYNVVYEQIVPKDKDYSTPTPGTSFLDLDTQSSDSNEYGQYGDLNWEEMFDVGFQPRHIYRKDKMLSMATNTRGFVKTDQTYSYIGVDLDAFSVGPIRCAQPTLVVFVVSNLEGEAGVGHLTPTEQEWPNMRYLGDTLKFALQNALGNIETGAETPFDKAMILTEKWLSPPAHGQVGAEKDTGLDVSGMMTAQLIIPGTLTFESVTPGG